MKIAVLVPCHDITYLVDCLSSIYLQSRKPDEIVLVLNGGALNAFNDGMIPRYLAPNIEVKILKIPENGIVNALNKGLLETDCDLIARMDADDVMPANRLNAQSKKFHENSNLVLLGGQMYDLHSGFQLHEYPLHDKEIRDSLLRFASFPHPGVMFKRKSALIAGSYRHDYLNVEDWDLWISISELGEIENLAECVLMYRKHPNQLTNENISKLKLADLNLVRARLILALRGKSLRLEDINQGHKSQVYLLNYLRNVINCTAGYAYVNFKRTKGIKKALYLNMILLFKPSWVFRKIRKAFN